MDSYADAVVDTPRAARYLDQLCRHADRMSRMPGHGPRAHAGGAPPPKVRRVEWADDRGTISFEGAECVLQADQQSLTLSLDAADDATLRRIQTMLAHRLETIGRRDELRVSWTPPAGDPPAAEPVDDAAPARARRRHLHIVAAVAALALVVAAHVGLVGAILGSEWTAWTVAAVVAVVLAKAAAVVLGHARLRRRAARSLKVR